MFLWDGSNSMGFGGEPLSLAYSGHLVLQFFGSLLDEFLEGSSTDPR